MKKGEKQPETKYCKDCKFYIHPQCRVYPPHPYFVPRKWTCPDFRRKKKG